MQYDGVYTCGHAGTVNIVGSTKDRKWKVDREFSGLCPECFKKAKQEKMEKERKEAAEKSAEMELPKLEGTEKQVAWANVIRMNAIKEYEQEIERYHRYLERKKEQGIPHDGYMYRRQELTEDDYRAGFNKALETFVEARYWIDERDKLAIVLRAVMKGLEQMKKENIPDDIKRGMEEEKTALTVCMENREKAGVVVIEIEADTECAYLYAKYIKDEKFIEIVKILDFRWNRHSGVWEKKITEYTGKAEERAAELGNKLLLAGFTVQFPNAESKEAALSGNFKPECKRWIKKQKTGKLAITWEGRNDFIYSSAKKISGAKWTDGYMSVPLEFYREVQDFANTFGFSVSKMAQEAIEDYRKKESGFECAEINAPKPETSDKEKVARLLRASGTVIEDLLDD